MKQTYEMTAPPLYMELLAWVAKKGNADALLTSLKKKIMACLPSRGQLLVTTAATLFVSCLFLAGSYLFFTQLATYGW